MTAWRRWVEACSSTERGTSLALFRVGIGLSLLWTLGAVWASDTLVPLWVDADHGGIRHVNAAGLLAWLGGATEPIVRGVHAAGVALAVALIAGLGGRLTAFASLIVFQALVETNGHAGGSYDLLLMNALWLCVLGDTTATLSVDCRLRRGRWTSAAPVGVWARYLVIVQLVVMYTSTGWQKLSSYWTPGGDFTALYYILQQHSWQRFDHSWAAAPLPLLLTQIGTGVTWAWEVAGPVLLLATWLHHTADRGGRLRSWFATLRVRELWIAIGLVMHLALLVLMNVGPFTPISLAFYAALLHPWEWERLGRRAVTVPR